MLEFASERMRMCFSCGFFKKVTRCVGVNRIYKNPGENN